MSETVPPSGAGDETPANPNPGDPDVSKQIELSKRSAAGMASSTKGRARVFRDKTKYDRKRDKKAGPGE
jgi:hypothetical protein